MASTPPSKRELVSGLIGILIGTGAVVGGVKTDAVNFCAGIEKGIAIGSTLVADAGTVVDAGTPGAAQ